MSPRHPNTRMGRPPFAGLVPLAFTVTLLAVQAPRADAWQSPANSPTRPVLRLRDGQYATGDMLASDEAGLLRWQSEGFGTPFEFPLKEIDSVQFPVPQDRPQATGDDCFELAAGDILYGALVALGDEAAEVDVPRLGRLHIDRAVIRRLYPRKGGAEMIFLGPNGLEGWSQVGSKDDAWHQELGQPWTSKEGASIRSEFQIPSRTAIEFEISWKNKPDFSFVLGTDLDEKSSKQAFRLEVWDRDIVVQRETDREADVDSVGQAPPGPGRIHLVAYLDREKNRLLVTRPDGQTVADLTVAGGKLAPPLARLSLTNRRGDVRLERLRIGRWSGDPPRSAQLEAARVHRVDGSLIYGKVREYDPSRGFAIHGQGGETWIPRDQVSSVFLSQPGDESPRGLRAVYQDGTRLSGDLLKVGRDAVTMKVAGLREIPQLPRLGLRSLVWAGAQSDGAKAAELVGLLDIGVALLRGSLVDSPANNGPDCLRWLPLGSRVAAALRPGASGRLVYREPVIQPQRPPVPARGNQPQGGAGFVVGFLSALAKNGGGATPNPTSSQRRCLHLRSGDVIPSDVTSIDDQGVRFKTALSTSTFVPHDKVQAVELNLDVNRTVRLTRTKRDRLLMLPRMQKPNPPTHLVESLNGDYLRGRLASMDEKALHFEVRLENKDVPRSRVSRIIWLHPEALIDATSKPAPAPRVENGLRVQAVRNDGIRLTFAPERLSGGVLEGKSDVLGPCKVRLKEVDQLLIGDGIEKAAAGLAYGRWRLQNAAEPRSASPDGGDGATGRQPGSESALVGKPAPDFELDLLKGGKFKLSSNKGRVIVLDFWATWCGPCLQAMPQVEKVAREYPETQVTLIAVNLQEEPKQIQAMLERHKLTPTVVLDRDGVVADRYAATAIPQTVVIDRDGQVARLFVGGGAHFEDQLRAAIKPLIPAKP